MFHVNWNRWSSEYLFQLFLFLKNLKRIMQSVKCLSENCYCYYLKGLLLIFEGLVADFSRGFL